MNKTARFYLPFLAVALIGCSHQPTSKYPGELGAPCSVDSDCKNGMPCTGAHMHDIEDPFCYVPCVNTDGECPEGSWCGDNTHAYLKADGGLEVESLRMCYRGCETAAFCRDLNPAFNACKDFGVAGQPICGIKG